MNDNQSVKQKIAQYASACASWLGAWCKENVDFAFVLAVFTETPRWTVTFMAIHEPLWIGVPLGVLLAFATSKVWKHYFRTRSGWTLGFNILAVALAMLVITPVLYAMMDAHPAEVDVTQVLADWHTMNPLRLCWAAGLALLTFVPLVQLASVHGAVEPVAQPPAPPAPPLHNEQSEDAQPPAQSATDAQPPTIDKRQRAKQMHGEGLPIAQISRDLEVHRNTVSAWVRTNGHAA